MESHVWDIEQDCAEDAWDMVYSIRLLFADRDLRRVGADDLRRQLLALGNDAVLSVQFDENLRPVAQSIQQLSGFRLFASPHPDPVQVFHPQLV
jgi:hypothetical protein